MAKENWVSLHGIALADARFKCDSGGAPVRGMLYLRVIDRINTKAIASETEVRYATIFVYTGLGRIIDGMLPIKEGDLVDVTGTLTTAVVPKGRKCPTCGEMNKARGAITYVTPQYICKRESGLSAEEAEKLLRQRCEVSNRICVIGSVTNGLEYYDGQGTMTPALQYQLSVPRTIRVDDDTAEATRDLPWVFTKGIQAEEGRDALRIGSVVYIRGHLRSKAQTKTVQCSKCDTVWESDDFPLILISPHFTEYLHNCNFPDSDINEYFSVDPDYIDEHS